MPDRLVDVPSNLMPLRSGRRGGHGFGFAWVAISGRVGNADALGIARAVLPPGVGLPAPRVDRRTRRRVLVVRDECWSTG